ncbi:hypothetical protein [Denitrobaculum tricleocarpae]|uniref:Uncharacterized protein n=1 Tax=Denitrobaculum tricleocarpae TaxID=2591009 RepID=A0A545TRJ4_9PROT|nr:hypothetical protein [Denitrobaculum tricleocarpae]TQV79850.1 hypothetical protein FKG95_14260 [Denitrobaculum tricleocarpae]
MATEMVQLRRAFKKKLKDSRLWRMPALENTSMGYAIDGARAFCCLPCGKCLAFCLGFPLFFIGGEGGFLIKEPGFRPDCAPVRPQPDQEARKAYARYATKHPMEGQADAPSERRAKHAGNPDFRHNQS